MRNSAAVALAYPDADRGQARDQEQREPVLGTLRGSPAGEHQEDEPVGEGAVRAVPRGAFRARPDDRGQLDRRKQEDAAHGCGRDVPADVQRPTEDLGDQQRADEDAGRVPRSGRVAAVAERPDEDDRYGCCWRNVRKKRRKLRLACLHRDAHNAASWVPAGGAAVGEA